jgi:hypothetical protein
MAKVLGVMMTILSSVALLGLLFLYQNSNAHLKYNPADKVQGLVDVGLALPVAMGLVFFTAGLILLFASKEPEKI